MPEGIEVGVLGPDSIKIVSCRAQVDLLRVKKPSFSASTLTLSTQAG
ncbi:MAG: hypothetical protein ACKVH8_01340 [Pirellulales bacterium]|jgi:hypothetical protein